MTEPEVKQVAEAVLRGIVVALILPLLVFLSVAIVSDVIALIFELDIYRGLARIFFLAAFVDFILAIGFAMSAANRARANGGHDEGTSR
jgi:hypothetical protein